MRSRRAAQDDMAAIARRRLEILTAELAGTRASAAMPVASAPDAHGDVPEPPASALAASPGTDAASRWSQAAGGSQAALGSQVAGGLQAAGWSLPAETSAPDGAGHGRLLDEWDAPPARGRHARRPVSASGRLSGWVHDRLPPTLQGRVRLTSGHLSVVALLVACGLALTAWWVVRADGSETVVPTATWSDAPPAAGASSTPLVTPAVDPTSTGAGEGEAAGVVVVDVTGKVRRPGIATLPIGSRVVDALEAAGGARRGVDLATLNLARVLVDGEQIVVGLETPEGVAASAASAPGAVSASGGQLVNINTATQAELEELPGVGPVTADAIIQWRTDNGPFTAVDELLEVSGIGEATLAEIAPFATL